MNEDRNQRHSRRKTTQDLLRTRKGVMSGLFLSTDVFTKKISRRLQCVELFSFTVVMVHV